MKALVHGFYNLFGAARKHWQMYTETVIQYQPKNADLLEEALESPKGGVKSIEKSHRHS
jgi:hypothetical protein